MQYENSNSNFSHQVIIDVDNCQAGNFILKNNIIEEIDSNNTRFSNETDQ